MCGREKKEKELGPIVEAQEKELGSNDCISWSVFCFRLK